MNVNDPPMDYFAQPSLSVNNLGSNRKRKADDDEEGRRVRSGAPPPLTPEVTMKAEDDDGWSSARMVVGDQENGRSVPAVSSLRDTSTPLRSSVLQEFSVASPSMMHSTPQRDSSQAVPGANYARRKRGYGEDLEEGETDESSKRMYSTATDAPSPILQQELGPGVVVFSYSGQRLGQLLPSGEILGFLELPPLAQRFDLYYLGSFTLLIKAEHTWIHHTWQQIHRSLGIESPSRQENYRLITNSGATSKFHTLRAIKTFRELGETRWQAPDSESFDETLNLLLKEMDYTVLLLLVHGHKDEQGVWVNRLKVLFGRLDPALRPKNPLANPTSSAVASGPNVEDIHNRTEQPYESLYHPLPLLMGSTLEHANFFNVWPERRNQLANPTNSAVASGPNIEDSYYRTQPLYQPLNRLPVMEDPLEYAVEDEPMEM